MKKIITLTWLVSLLLSTTSLSAETDYSSIGIASGLILTSAFVANSNFDINTYDFRQDYLPNFRYHYDDYLQYLPAAAMLGLKATGVPSASSWPKMLVSDAFAIALNALMVNSLKYTISRERPDQSRHNSFPSGHTATAFMTATMLNKEYGSSLSPWIGFGGYAVATATALSRITNNKHWFSDLLCGAGIGILSTELGYVFSELIFNEATSDGFTTQSDDTYEKNNYLAIGMGPIYLEDTAGNGKWGNQWLIQCNWYFSPNWGGVVQCSMDYAEGSLRNGLNTGIVYGYSLTETIRLETSSSLAIEYTSQALPGNRPWEMGLMVEAGLGYRIRPHLMTQLYANLQYLPQYQTETAVGLGIKCCYLW
ncbi:MAG: phosphatase PAP2 family protein [Bacteroidales bacterium]|nr:phosphatase PAP2 family protein [Bacteroidales bacterium]